MKGRTGKSRFTILDVTTACASLCLRGVLPGVPGGQRGPGGLSSATQPKESSTRANSKMNPLSAYPFCRHEPGRRILILPPRAASQPSPTCVSSISTRFTVRGIIILGSKSGYAVSPSPSSLVFPVQLTDLNPHPYPLALTPPPNSTVARDNQMYASSLFPAELRHHGPSSVYCQGGDPTSATRHYLPR